MALGDKDASFVGSSKWIGAVELGYILDEYCGITVKVRCICLCARCGVCALSCLLDELLWPALVCGCCMLHVLAVWVCAHGVCVCALTCLLDAAVSASPSTRVCVHAMLVKTRARADACIRARWQACG